MKSIYIKFKKELLIMLSIVLTILGFSTYIMNHQSSKFLLKEHYNQLDSVKNTLKVNAESYFKSLNNTLLTLSSNQSTIIATLEFTKAFEEMSKNKNVTVDKTIITKHLNSFIEKVSYDIPGAIQKRKIKDYIPKTNVSRALQMSYIYKNPFDSAQRFKLLETDNNFEYDKVHKDFHPYFLNELKKYAFYDMFIIDNSGNVVYSVFKENDFASNIVNGIYKESGLANVFTKTIRSLKETIVFDDFKPYEPSYNQPAAFIATPIFNGDTRLGVLAIQIPIKEINKIMTINNSHEKSGLGKSGEAYLVGSDLYMRSDSRFLDTIENRLIKKFSSTVGIIKVDTPAVHRAFKGENSKDLIRDYRGTEVYSSYQAINVFDKRWVIVSEIDKSEVDYEIKQTTSTLLISSFLVFIVFTFTLLHLFIKLILNPIRKNEELLSDNLRLKNKALLTSESMLSEYKRAVDLSSIVSRADLQGIITYVNDEFCKVSGYSRDELIGQPHNIVRHPDTPKIIFKKLWTTIRNKHVWKGVIKNIKKDGSFYYINSTIMPILDEDKEIAEYMSIRTDITDLILKEAQILKQTVCPLTLLPNRQKLLEDIENISNNTKLATISIHKFMDIHDFYGKDIAHFIIKNISGILKHLLYNDKATLYIISDYEFAVLTQKNILLDHFEKLLKNIIDHFDRNAIEVEDNQFNIAINIGIASNKDDRIFINSHAALRKAIELSKSLMIFENSLEIKDEYKKNIDMTLKIKEAIANDQIVVFAQPITPNKIGDMQKYECLVRMKDGDSILSPFFFLEIAKKARLYPTLTKIIIEKSFKYFEFEDCEFSINLTLQDIHNEETVSFLKRKIKQYNVGKKLVIEIVESEGIEEYDTMNDFILPMKSLGCKIAIDDFGTGYSNFEYLMKLNTDYIKIDGSLIKDLDTDKNAQIVVQLIVDFAKRLNIKVIAEYVHKKEVLDKVVELDIDYSQGYFVGKPKEIFLD